MQKDINKKVLSLKSGSRHAFKSLIRDGCDGLFMYGMAIEGDKDRAKELMERTYIKVWEKRAEIEEGRMYDNWLKRMMIREARLMEGGDKSCPRGSKIIERAYFGAKDKSELVKNVIEQCGR